MGFPYAIAVGLLLAMPRQPLPADQSSLEALAAASGRPRECGSSAGKRGRARKPTVWRRARIPELVPYCDLLAKAHVLLDSDAKAALELAEKAESTWPGHAGALVAEGRALLGLGKAKEALEKLEKAKEIDKLSVEEPKAMHARARALILNGQLREGADLYRTMVPRGSLLSERQRARLLLEAAFASMADAGRASKEPGARPIGEALAEATSFIAEARSSEAAGMSGDILLGAALIYDRAGDAEKAGVALAEASRSKAKPTDAASYVADAADASALTALSLESTSPSEAAQAWSAYADASKIESYASSARARASALKGGRGTSAKPPKTPKKKGAKAAP